jgi:hypothetical protein
MYYIIEYSYSLICTSHGELFEDKKQIPRQSPASQI